MKSIFALLTLFSLPWFSVVAGPIEDSSVFDIYVYQAKNQIDYWTGGSKEHGRAAGITYVGALTRGEIGCDQLSITFQGAEPRVIHAPSGEPCLVLQPELDLPDESDPSVGTLDKKPELQGNNRSLTFVNYTNTSPSKRWQIWNECKTKDLGGMPEDTFAMFGFFVVRRDGSTRDESLETELIDQLNRRNIHPRWMEEEQIEQAFRDLNESGGRAYAYAVSPRAKSAVGVGNFTVSTKLTLPGGCAACSVCSNSVDAGRENLDVSVPVTDEMDLRIRSDLPRANYDEADVVRVAIPQGADVGYEDGKLRHMELESEVVTISPRAGGGLELSVYHKPSASKPGSEDLASVIAASSLINRVRLDSLAADGSLVELTLDKQGQYPRSSKVTYQFISDDEGAEGWLVRDSDAASGLPLKVDLVTRKTESIDGMETLTEITRVMDPSDFLNEDAALLESRKVFTAYEIEGKPRWFLTRSVRGLGADEEVTSYGYVDPLSSAKAAGKLAWQKNHDGDWVYWEYDTEGRLLREIRSYLANSFDETAEYGDLTALADANRVTEYEYSPVNASDVGGHVLVPRTVIQKLAGQVISKRMTLITADAEYMQRAVSPTAGWDAAGNLEEIEFHLWRDNVAYTEDGLLRHRKVRYEGDIQRIIVDTGVPSLGKHEASSAARVIKGYRTITEYDQAHDDRMHSSANYRIHESGEKILLSEVTYEYGLSDRYDHRVTRKVYWDGTSESYEYACCGLEAMTDRDGIRTEYAYDTLFRRIRSTRAGVSSHTELDGAGRVKFSYSSPADDFSQQLGKATAAPVYNSLGEVIERSDAVGRVTLMDRAESGGVVTYSTTLPGGSTRIERSYADGTQIETLGTALRPMSYTESWDSNGQRVVLQAYSAAPDEFTRTVYDFLGRMIRSERPSPGGNGLAVTQTEYDPLTGRMRASIDPAGLKTLYLYNDLGEQDVTAIDVNDNGVVDVAGPDRISKSLEDYVYLNAGSELSELSALSELPEQWLRRSRSWVWQTAASDESTLIASRWSTLDGLISVDDRFGLVSSRERIRDVTNAAVLVKEFASDGSSTQQFSVDGLPQWTTRQDAQGNQIARQDFGYDVWNRRNQVTDAGTGTRTTTFHDDGSVESVSTPDPDAAGPLQPQLTRRWSSGLNGLGYANGGRIEKVLLPDNTEVTRTYLPTGELLRQEGSRQYPVEYAYDHAGRMSAMSTWQDKSAETGKATTTWSYNPAGAMTAKRYQDGQGPDYSYDARGLLLSRTWARGLRSEYGYNLLGELESVDAYDALNQPLQDALVRNSYDRLGRLQEVQDNSGTRSYLYSENLQLLEEEYTAGELATWKLQRSYDSLLRPAGTQLQQAATLKHDLQYTYDGASRLKTVRGHGLEHTYSYASNRPLLASLDQGGIQEVTWRYDALNRLTQIQTGSSSGTLSSHHYEYNQANQRVKATLLDGSAWVYDYDELGQVISGIKQDSTGVAIPGYQFGYEFDDIGNRKQFSENGSVTSYTANLLNQYTTISRPAQTFLRGNRGSETTKVEVDLVGDAEDPVEAEYRGRFWSHAQDVTDLVSEFNITATENGNSHSSSGVLLTPNGEEQPQLDVDGNLTRDHLWNYVWDSENRLVQQTHRSDISLVPLQPKRMSYLYDSQGRRFKRIISSLDALTGTYVPEEIRFYIYDGWNLLAELDENGNLLRDYVWGSDLSGTMQGAGGVGGLLSVDAEAAVALPVYDGNGNVMAYTSSSSGALVAEHEYDPFGRRIKSTGSQVNEYVHRFSTKVEDTETGLLYYGFRYYDPETGRWLNRDPIQEYGGVNLYKFIGNKGLNAIDILGLKLKVFQLIGEDRFTVFYRNNFNAFILSSLKLICSSARIEDDGTVTVAGKPNIHQRDYYGCCCLYELTTNKFDNLILFNNNQKLRVEPVAFGDELLRHLPNGFHGPPSPGIGTAGKVLIDPSIVIQEKRNNNFVDVPPFIILAHELCGHLVLFNRGTQRAFGPPNPNHKPPNHEIDAVQQENIIRRENGLPIRTTYGGPNRRAGRKQWP